MVWALKEIQGDLYTYLFVFFVLLPYSLLRPDLIDFDKLKKSNAHYNLQNAFNLAEQHLGLTKLLDPEGKCCWLSHRCLLYGPNLFLCQSLLPLLAVFSSPGPIKMGGSHARKTSSSPIFKQ